MVGVSEAFDLARTGNREAAASVLKQEFQRLQSSDQKVELCEWIAVCFESLSDFGQAADWYEMAGSLSLSETGAPLTNALMALRHYERALVCRQQSDDAEAIEECIQVIKDLRHAYSAS
jgi:tetratricopeptide (TPR) repeat protein